MNSSSQSIYLKKVAVHNLKNINLEIPKYKLIVFTGVSGSGKSSLAFDTIYTEGQRRYIESLSVFARRQIGDFKKPDIESAQGLSPTISIEQKTAGKNPRSTVGTLTEIYDYLRLLFARVAIPHCPKSGEPVQPQSKETIIRLVQTLPHGSEIMILAPHARGKKGSFKEDFQHFIRKGYSLARIDNVFHKLTESIELEEKVAHTIDVVIDKLQIFPENSSKIAEAVSQALNLGEGLCYVVLDEGRELFFSVHAYSQKSGLSYHALEPTDFSFNSTQGMCPKCHGLGTFPQINLKNLIDPEKSIAEDCCALARSYKTILHKNICDNLARLFKFRVSTPWKDLSEEVQKIYLYGAGERPLYMEFKHPEKKESWYEYIVWEGVIKEIEEKFKSAKTERGQQRMEEHLSVQTCPECNGGRLKPYALAARLNEKTIAELTALPLTELFSFFENISLTPQEWFIAEEVIKEIKQRLIFLNQVGLHYLTLDRTAPTLSGGESQRVRLAAQIGCGLVGVTYILDEPSIGLHPIDNERLIQTLKQLRDRHNTVIVVEHDEETIWAADHIVEFGPGAGVLGGEIIVNGSLKDLLNHPTSRTGGYLSGRLEIPIPKKRRKAKKEDKLIVSGANHHNLKNVTLNLPLGIFVAVVGVSGSGKSTLISDILHPALSHLLHGANPIQNLYQKIEGLEKIDKVIAIDQSPIGKNPRSNPATYIKVFDDIRNIFVNLPESNAKGFKVGRFSFNVKEGSCSECEGMGMVKLDMDFMEDSWSDCPLCNGQRFDEQTLSVRYRGKNIYEILEMSIEEAHLFFDSIRVIKHKLQTLIDVGLGYLKLGQPSPTLSGGEAQRIKLAKEFVRPSTGKTLYILDEPTTGLHFQDVHLLINLLQRLVERGNSVLVIEHNTDVIKVADWLIELGPSGGAAGGYIIAEGTPEAVAKKETPTGKVVRSILAEDRTAKVHQVIEKCADTSVLEHSEAEEPKYISIQGASQHNLKHLDVEIPRNKITVCTGPSGSGKSSFAFDTVYAEGQRRYVESLSAYARQFIEQMPKPKIEQVQGLSPAVAIEQRVHSGNPRSTVGTLTEIYDYLRLLFAYKGTAYCPQTGEKIQVITKESVVEKISEYPEGSKVHIYAPIDLRKEQWNHVLGEFSSQGFTSIRLNGKLYELDEEIPFESKRKNELLLLIDRLKISKKNLARLNEAVEVATRISKGKMILLDEQENEVFFNLSFSTQSGKYSYEQVTPNLFAFNTPHGMCSDCAGTGMQRRADFQKLYQMGFHSVFDIISILSEKYCGSEEYFFFTELYAKGKIPFFDSFGQLTVAEQKIILTGEKEYGATNGNVTIKWKGLDKTTLHLFKSNIKNIKKFLELVVDEIECFSCKGTRLNPLARSVRIENSSIADFCKMPIHRASTWIKGLILNEEEQELLGEVKEQILSRLSFLIKIGVGYLSLDRRSPSLSGGETQRIRLASQLGSGLTGILYVLDEPTIGLHPQDNQKLNDALEDLRKLGNTLLLVEHDPLTIAHADYILDFGPVAGEKGGHIMARGNYDEILENPNSLTGVYLSGKKRLKMNKNYLSKKVNKKIEIENACANNLKNISVAIPLNKFVCITGVSGSGKSTLMHNVLGKALELSHLSNNGELLLDQTIVKGLHHFKKFQIIDQNPIGQNSRADVATYSDLLTPIREIFGTLYEARRKGLSTANFSYNHRSGMCPKCQGLGHRKIQMQFMPAIQMTCEECKGLRLNPVSLSIQYKGKNLGEFLQLSLVECLEYFSEIKKIKNLIDTFISIGLGYLKLGQEILTLSGGEAQRLRLGTELASSKKGETLYFIDEPTTGLHADDVAKLIKVFEGLLEKGHSLIVIEHHTDLIECADFLIDIGPGAGIDGGEIIFTGTPLEAKKTKKSVTGKYLFV